MKKYEVIITGTWTVEVEAKDEEQAEDFAYQQCVNSGMDLELMNLEYEAYCVEDENLSD